MSKKVQADVNEEVISAIDEFRSVQAQKREKINEIENTIQAKDAELKEVKGKYDEAILNDSPEAVELLSKVKSLELEIDMLGHKKALVQAQNNDKELKELAEKVKKEAIAAAKELYEERKQLRANIGIIEQECKDRLRENGAKIYATENKMREEAKGVLEVLNYIDSYNEGQKKLIRTHGEEKVLSQAGMI